VPRLSRLIFVLSVVLVAPAASQVPEECGVFYMEDDEIKNAIVNGLSVITLTQAEGGFVLPELPVIADTLYCFRSDFVPAENDYKVILAGYFFYIFEGARTGTLEYGDEGFTYDQIAGASTTEEVQMRIVSRLRDFNAAASVP
jgi:hypothetical protein